MLLNLNPIIFKTWTQNIWR